MGIQKNCLLITYSSEVLNGEPLIVSSNCLPVKAANLEPAGHAFHNAVLKRLGFEDPENAGADDNSVSSDDRSQDSMPFSDFYSSKGKKKSGSGSQQDHYALLGLGHLRFLATEDQIKKSYREMALRHHPDKHTTLVLAEKTEAAQLAKKNEIENHFKFIQEAYEVLMDPVKRRIYDSTDEFDDDVPTDCAPQDFYKVFGLCFLRNGRWSVNQPIPSLGDDSTPLNEVDKFYNFWYSFKSWREFPHADEYDLEQAESREHKRWMERQNIKMQEKARKAEYARIRDLVDNAYKRDPRILMRREKEKAEKQKRKEAKYLAKKLEEEEAAKVAEEEKRRKEEEDRKAAADALNQKKLKEKEKKLLRKEKSRLRSLTASIIRCAEFNLSEEDVETTCTTLDMEALKQLCDSMESKNGDDIARLLRHALKKESSVDSIPGKEVLSNGSVNSTSTDNHKTPPNSKSKHGKDSLLNNFEKKERPWDKEEIEMLRKAMLKYPKGTSRRWEVISDFLGTNRSVEEILKATKTVLLQKPDSAKAFDSFLEKRKPVVNISSPLSMRVVPETQPAGASDAAPSSSSTTSAASDEPTTVPASNSAYSAADQDFWSETQELALVQALKTFPKEISQRWERVATAVPGKTVLQCKKKFSLMKESFRNKKSC